MILMQRHWNKMRSSVDNKSRQIKHLQIHESTVLYIPSKNDHFFVLPEKHSTNKELKEINTETKHDYQHVAFASTFKSTANTIQTWSISFSLWKHSKKTDISNNVIYPNFNHAVNSTWNYENISMTCCICCTLEERNRAGLFCLQHWNEIKQYSFNISEIRISQW